MTAVLVDARSAWRGLGPEGRFPLRFLAALALLGPLALWALDPLSRALIAATVAGVEVVAGAAGLAAVVGEDGAMGFANGAFGYEVVAACTVAVPGVVYAAAVLAFPASGRRRALGLLFGLPCLFALNVVRLVGLAYAGVDYPASYEMLHWFGFQVLLVFATAAVFVAWVAWARREERARLTLGWSGLRSAGLFAVTFVALMALGWSDSVVSLYSRVVSAIYWPVGSRLWPDIDYSHYELFPWRYALSYYATHAAFLGFVAAARSRTPRERLVMALEMAPIVVALASLDLLCKVGIDVSSLRGGFWASHSDGAHEALWVARRLVLAGVPLWMWWRWASPVSRKDRDEAPANASHGTRPSTRV